MKRKLKQKIGQAILLTLFYISNIAFIYYGIVTATTLR